MRRVLITGGDGYLGRRIADHYLAAGWEVTLWVRASGGAEYDAKRTRLSAYQKRGARLHCGDLRETQPFRGIAADIDHIVHAAGLTRFNVDRDAAWRVNVEGTTKLLEFASRCRRLEAIGLLGSLYASGLTTGHLPETRFAGMDGHANHYEWSKWATEERLFAEYGHLPWRLMRIGTIVADDPSGRVSRYNAVHNSLKLLFYGLLSVVPGRAHTPLYLATGDYAAHAAFRCMHAGRPRGIYHLTHDASTAPTLGELIDIAYAAFDEDPSFTGRNVLRPLYVNLDGFRTLQRGTEALAGEVVTGALSTVAPFAAQLFVEKHIANAAALDATRLRVPGMHQVLTRTCRHVAATRWGREPSR